MTLLRDYVKIENLVFSKQQKGSLVTTMVSRRVLPRNAHCDEASDPGKGGFPVKHVTMDVTTLSDFCFELISDRERGFSRPSAVIGHRNITCPLDVTMSRYVATD